VAVKIMAIGKKDPVYRVITDKDGHYEIKVKLDSTYDLWYTHTKMETSIVVFLSGGKNQHINKVLYARGEKRPISAMHETFLSAERMMFYALSVAPEDRKNVVLAIQESGLPASWEKLPGLTDGSDHPQVREYFMEKVRFLRNMYLSLR
jgi:hypothetical protein